MAELKSAAHPEWPYAGTVHEWRGFVKMPQFIVPLGFQLADIEKAKAEWNKPGGIIEIVYQKQNFGPELK